MANQMMPPMGQDTNSYYGGQQIPHEPQINYQNFRTANVPQQQQQQPPPQPIVKEKAPLPEQFIYLQTVFEELKTQCVQTAANPVRTFIR